jgi:hypothetical protein
MCAMRDTAVENLKREMGDRILMVHLDGEDVTQVCTAFDTDEGWVDLLDREGTKRAGTPQYHRKRGQVTVTKQTTP